MTTKTSPSAADVMPESRAPCIQSSSVATDFDYTGVAPELAAALRADAGRIRDRITKSTSDLIEIGRALNSAKAKLGHGRFLQWVEFEIGIHRRTAQRYMGVADLADAKGDTVSLLTPGAAYLLSAKSTPPEIVAGVIERVEAGERITDEVVDSLVREAKAQRRDNRREAPKECVVDVKPLSAPDQNKHNLEPGREVGAHEIAQKILRKVGPELARFLLNSLKPDVHAVLEKLEEALAQSSVTPEPPGAVAHGSPPASAPIKVGTPTKDDIGNIPSFLDRRAPKGGAA